MTSILNVFGYYILVANIIRFGKYHFKEVKVFHIGVFTFSNKAFLFSLCFWAINEDVVESDNI